MVTRKFRPDLAAAFLVSLTLFVAISALAAVTLDGQVVDPNGSPVPGATITGVTSSGVTRGTASDKNGRFHLQINSLDGDSIRLFVSSVGFAGRRLTVAGTPGGSPLRIVLEPGLTEVSGITVVSPPPSSSEHVIRSGEITRLSRFSLVPSNPVAALQAPQISRVGSNHSSQLRVHGTNPVYLLNGLPIGTDPDHYGVFSVIPAPVVNTLDFHPQGTSARFELPATVEITTPTPFGEATGGQVMASTVDVTAYAQITNERMFALGTLRKSVLDHLVKTFNISSDRATLPPTNFQDVYISAGMKATSRWRVMVDQYNVRDFLSYNTNEAVSTSNDIDTYQHRSESYTALRSELIERDFTMRSSVALKNQTKSYRALPAGETSASAISADIRETSHTMTVDHDFTWYRGPYEVSAGFQISSDLTRDYHLAQTNWNFLPPFAATDNPYIYQEALNETYDSFDGAADASGAALYVSMLRHLGVWQVESGLRYDRFSPLEQGARLNYRLRVERPLGEGTTVSLFHGTFTQSPLDNILEPYQVLVRAYLDELTPVKTTLWSLGVVHGPFTVNLFHKRIDRLPVTTPDFDNVYDKYGNINDDFIAVRSTGQAHFNGVSISARREGLLDGRFDLEGSYAYTHGDKVTDGISMPYDLTAPHRLIGRAAYQLNPRFRLAAEGQVRSGYPFTPLRVYPVSSEARYYSEEYYRSMLTEENTLRFAANAYLNLSATYTTGHTDIYLTLSNLTNRANPIINTTGGIVYDAGILPMLGINYRF